jgi:hypothetical protein
LQVPNYLTYENLVSKLKPTSGIHVDEQFEKMEISHKSNSCIEISNEEKSDNLENRMEQIDLKIPLLESKNRKLAKCDKNLTYSVNRVSNRLTTLENDIGKLLQLSKSVRIIYNKINFHYFPVASLV